MLVSGYRHNLGTGSGSIAGATSRSRTTDGGVFGPPGVTDIRTFTDPQNPTRVAVLMDVADLDTTIAALQTAAASDAMDHDGVLADTMVLLVETGR